MKKRIFAILFAALSISATAQDTWDLQQCIDYALKNNIAIKQTALGVESANYDRWQAKANRWLPSLNGFGNWNYNEGQTVDRFTNQFASSLVQSNNFYANLDMTLFNGFNLLNAMKKSKLDFQSSIQDVEKIKQDIALTVATSYLQVLFAEELLLNAQNQRDDTQRQLKRIQKLVNAGASAKGALLDIEAQAATEELSIVNAENQLSMAYLTLRQLMELDSLENFKIKRPKIEILDSPVITSTPGQVYDQALGIMPGIKSATLKVTSAEYGTKQVRGLYYPRLSLTGSLGTGFSGLSKEYTPTGQYDSTLIAETSFGDFYAYNPIFESETKNFFVQLGDNFNKSFGLTLSIPILNGFQTRIGVARAKIAEENAMLNLENARNQLQKDVEQAYVDAQASLKRHRAAKKSVKALKETFKYSEQRFNVGMVNSVDYYAAKNRLARSESELLQAKYEFLFKSKVLDFYQGKSLAF